MRFYPFAFTGKEKDEETGYGYFGARYMDHELMTMWLNVDPLADKYPNISPYAYCAWNPIRIIDPGGDTLFVLDSRSQQDIRNVAGKYQDRILFEERGMMSIDYSELSESDLCEMINDTGIKLLQDIYEAPQKILYESKLFYQISTKNGALIEGNLYSEKCGIMNVSRGGLDSRNAHTYFPLPGYEGNQGDRIRETGTLIHCFFKLQKYAIFLERQIISSAFCLQYSGFLIHVVDFLLIFCRRR